MWVCSGTHSDSNPRSSRARANGPGCMEPSVKNMTAPIFMAALWPVRGTSGTAGRAWWLSLHQKEIAMRAIRSIVTLATLAVGVAACSVNDGYYAPRSQAAYYPATTAYYSTPASTAVYTSQAPVYYNVDPPNFQKSNVYSSRCDYY